MAAIITKTESIAKPGLAVDVAFVPNRIETFEYDTEAEARESFERSFQHHYAEYGDVERDANAFEAQTSPGRRMFVELTIK